MAVICHRCQHHEKFNNRETACVEPSCLTRQLGAATLKCFACGEQARAFWSGVPLVGVCGACALDVLPKLLADAATYGHAQPHAISAATRVWEQARSAYWYAVACLVHRTPKVKLPEAVDE